jgi:hypothetical protein
MLKMKKDLMLELTTEEAHRVLAYLQGYFEKDKEFMEVFEKRAEKIISQREGASKNV